ncbi:Superkiller protein 3 [Coemansia erecta]|nr:Superkiller protein 3 [Coemansia sp. RSA 2618]KAJ2830045.1 Superkiller protein 3 [Coemansia erecta]
MSVIYKAKLKAAKTAVSEKNYDYAYDLCHDLLELDADSYPVHILLGVSCQHMEKWAEGERVYQRAMELPKANTLAWQGQCALFEASGDHAKHEHALRSLCSRLVREGNTDKAWETMHKLIELLEGGQTGDPRRLVCALRELAPEGEYHALLGAEGADPRPPTTDELLERMYSIESELDERLIDSEVSKRRTRLGAGPVQRVRAEVRAEVFGASGLLETLAQLVAHTLGSASVDVERLLANEERYFACLDDRLAFVEPRAPAVEQLANLAEDLVANNRCAAAFMLLIEMADFGERLAELVPQLIELFPDAPLAPAARAWTGDEECADVAKEAPESPFARLQAVLAAERVGRDRGCVDAAARARQAQQAFADKYGVVLARSRVRVDLAAADAYLRIGAEHAGDAEQLYRACLESDADNKAAALGLGLATCALGNRDEGCGILQRLVDADPGNHRAWGGLAGARLEAGDLQGAVDAFQQAIAAEPLHAQHHAGLAAAYWRMGGAWQSDKQYAYASWLAAARVDAAMPAVFSGLGQWYQIHGGDPERATRCFAKAVSLDCTDAVAGPLLADIYAREGLDDECEQLLHDATDALFAQPWAWRRLGFLYLRQGASERAVSAFQNALSADRADCVCWEGLCEAYLGIGRIHTAVKVAQKAVALDPRRVSAHWLCAQASMRARTLDAALRHFDDAVECAQGDLMWARVLTVARAECLTLCAERWFHDGLFGRVAEASSDALKAVACVGPQSFLEWGIVHVSCMWLVRVRSQFVAHPQLVDAETVGTLLGCAHKQQAGHEPLPSFIASVTARAQEETRECEPLVQQLFVLAAMAARLRVLLADSTTLASASWADLGCVYYAHSMVISPSSLLFAGQPTDTPNALLDAAADCALAAVQLDGANARAANLQGAVAGVARNAGLAQHALIVATRRAPLSGLPWANLGFVYLAHNDVELANKAFARAQMLEPDLYAGWMGQALIAEHMESAECVDLYEACLLLEGVSTEIADFGYAQQVWRVFVKRFDGVADTGRAPVLSHAEQNRLLLAIHAARRYVARTTDGQGAGNLLLGMLLEHNGEYENAASAYGQALGKVPAGAEHEWAVWSSLARAQCSSGQYPESMDSYSRAAELLEQPGWEPTSGQRLGFLLGHSLALFFGGELEASLHMFERTLERAETASEQAVVAVMLAQVLWALGTDEHRQLARQHLVDTMAEHSGYVPGLALLFAMGMLAGDSDLVTAANAELQHVQCDPAHHCARLESYLAVLRDDPQHGRRALSRALFRAPDDASVWLLSADFDSLCARTGGVAARAALRLFGVAVRGHHSWSNAPLVSMVNSASLDVAVAALNVLARDEDDKSAARKAVMYQPWVEQNWGLIV